MTKLSFANGASKKLYYVRSIFVLWQRVFLVPERLSGSDAYFTYYGNIFCVLCSQHDTYTLLHLLLVYVILVCK